MLGQVAAGQVLEGAAPPKVASLIGEEHSGKFSAAG